MWGRPAARGGDVATSCGGGATQRYSLSTRQTDGAPVAVEEDAAAMAKLLLVSLVAKSCKVVVGLLVGESDKGDFMSRSRSLYCHSDTGPTGSTAVILREKIRSSLSRPFIRG